MSDNILDLAKKSKFKKIVVIKNTWSNRNWCIVEKVIVKPDNKYCFAFGHIHYADGKEYTGKIPGAGTFSWSISKILEDDMQVEYLEV